MILPPPPANYQKYPAELSLYLSPPTPQIKYFIHLVIMTGLQNYEYTDTNMDSDSGDQNNTDLDNEDQKNTDFDLENEDQNDTDLDLENEDNEDENDTDNKDNK